MIILFLCALTVLLPLYVTISMSMKTSAQSVDGNALSLPSPVDFSGFARAWELTNFPVTFVITTLLFLAVLSVMYINLRNFKRQQAQG